MRSIGCVGNDRKAKVGVLSFGFVLFFVLSYVFVGAKKANDVTDVTEKLEENVDKATSKWDYLGEEWRTILLKSAFISGLNSFFEKISFVFSFLFGEPYSLSLVLLIVIFLWIFLFFQMSAVFKNLIAFSPIVSSIIAFAITVIFAQFKILRAIAEFFFWIVFIPDQGWMKVILVVLLIVVLIIVARINTYFGKLYKKSKEDQKKELEKIESMSTRKVLGGFVKGFGKD